MPGMTESNGCAGPPPDDGDAAGGLVACRPFSPLRPDEVSTIRGGTFEDGEQSHSTFGDVSLFIGGGRDEGVGSALVTTRRLIWLSHDDTSKGYAVGYRAVMVHAVSRDLQAFDKPCVFIQLDSHFDMAEDDDEEDMGDNDAQHEVSELHLVPVSPDQLEPLFQAMSECAALNPDSDDEGDEGDFYYNEEEVMAGVDPETREAMMTHFENVFQAPEEEDLLELVADDPSRFDDAEEDEQ